MLDGSFLLNRDASGVAGCEFSIRFTDRGYSAVEPFINWLSTTPYQINKLEANDSKSWAFIDSKPHQSKFRRAPENWIEYIKSSLNGKV